jgi:hypothetical protein
MDANLGAAYLVLFGQSIHEYPIWLYAPACSKEGRAVTPSFGSAYSLGEIHFQRRGV